MNTNLTEGLKNEFAVFGANVALSRRLRHFDG